MFGLISGSSSDATWEMHGANSEHNNNTTAHANIHWNWTLDLCCSAGLRSTQVTVYNRWIFSFLFTSSWTTFNTIQSALTASIHLSTSTLLFHVNNTSVYQTVHEGVCGSREAVRGSSTARLRHRNTDSVKTVSCRSLWAVEQSSLPAELRHCDMRSQDLFSHRSEGHYDGLIRCLLLRWSDRLQPCSVAVWIHVVKTGSCCVSWY